MYERQLLSMDVAQELMMDNESSISFSDADNIIPTTVARYQAEPNNTIVIAPQSSQGGEYSGSQIWLGSNSAYDATGRDDDDNDDDDYDDDDSNSQFSGPVSNNNTISGLAGQSMRSSVGSGKPAGEQRPRKLPGPRPTRTLEEMTPLEAERRRRRRERNKNAAAKCRQRRVEQTNTLLTETEELERESNRLEREIETLRRQKNQLEYVLDAHKPSCTAVFTDVKPNESTLSSVGSSVSTMRPNNLPISSMPATCRSNMITSSASLLDGRVFSYDSLNTPAGLTPMLMAGDLSSPSSYVMLSPSALFA